MKRYVIVSGDFTTHGGMDCANYHLAWHLAEIEGADVHLVAYRVQPPLAGHRNVQWHRVTKLFNSYTLSEQRLNRAGQAVARSMRDARVIVNGGNCDWGDVNWVHYVHSAWQPQGGGSTAMRLRRAVQHRRNVLREKQIVPGSRLVIVNSQRTRHDVIHQLGVSARRVRTIYYGIDAERFRPASAGQREAMRRELGIASEQPAVAFVGALGDRRKGFDLVFDAWKMLDQRWDWNATMLVIGQGAELQHWKSRAADAGLRNRIRFLGFQQDMPDLLRAADLLVAPARYEAYGLGVHEAICCGLPAIVSAHAGVAERFPATLKRLLLPEPLTPERVADRLQYWQTATATLAADAGDFARVLRSRSWREMASEIVQVIKETNSISPEQCAASTASPPRRNAMRASPLQQLRES